MNLIHRSLVRNSFVYITTFSLVFSSVTQSFAQEALVGSPASGGEIINLDSGAETPVSGAETNTSPIIDIPADPSPGDSGVVSDSSTSDSLIGTDELPVTNANQFSGDDSRD